MDLDKLREYLLPLVLNLKDSVTNDRLPELCERLGLPIPEDGGTKRGRMRSSFSQLSDESLPIVAQSLLELHPPHAQVRNQIQDLLWSDSIMPNVPKRFRREVARALEGMDLHPDIPRFQKLLEQLWVLEPTNEQASNAFFLGEIDASLGPEIERHVYRNPDDWTTEQLFDNLGAFDSSSKRFALFLEGIASGAVCVDELSQRTIVERVNLPLSKCGVELRETSTEDGYPVFTLVSTQSGNNDRPKNLIFASTVKPDLRFKDSISNNIEIVTNADKVLVYDRAIGHQGLLWRELQSWWSDKTNEINADIAKAGLYRRLRDSLPANSPAQLTLFELYYKGYGPAIPDLPALIPEVWLHWDPKTVSERGALALTRFRMDFLVLLPGGVRVVIEVDGKHHYSNKDGKANANRYACMATADRELKLAGYEVFRFGVAELQRADASEIVRKFFDSLFRRYGIRVP